MAENTLPPWERDLTMADFTKKGIRVMMHPGTDWWLRGDRYGKVTKVDRAKGLLHVKLDRSGKSIRVQPESIDPGSFDPSRMPQASSE